ncbi:MAG TPA: cupredoxin domain-containing protein [Syntrophales bacterium]|nr:cupredoxin domain-containing protein [Syntrophales bacterium]
MKAKMNRTKNRMPIAVLAVLLFFLGVFLTEVCAIADEAEQVVTVTAKRYEYNPNTITVKKGIPVVLEFTSLDRLHGFSCPGLAIRTDIAPGKVATLRFVPQKAGTFPFHCDNFCGSGHEGMTGTIVVTE